MKYLFFSLVVCIIAGHVSAQEVSDFEDELYASYIENKMAVWDGILTRMAAEYEKGKDAELLYSLCFAQYGYIGYCIGEDMDKEAKEFLNKAIKNAEELDELYNGRHDVLALRGALLGFKIMLSKFSSLYLGPQAYRLIQTASESSDIYFNCSLEIGNMRFFTPKFLGGSKKEAIAYYENAVKILENSPKKEKHNWIYMNTIILLAKAYEETGSKEKACTLYIGLLEYEPGARWVREELMEKSKCFAGRREPGKVAQ